MDVAKWGLVVAILALGATIFGGLASLFSGTFDRNFGLRINEFYKDWRRKTRTVQSRIDWLFAAVYGFISLAVIILGIWWYFFDRTSNNPTKEDTNIVTKEKPGGDVVSIKCPTSNAAQKEDGDTNWSRAFRMPSSETRAVSELKIAAGNGDPDAQDTLGIMYALGKDVDRDKETALWWLQRAAQQGYANGQVNLGLIYEGIPQKSNESIAAYRSAALQNNPRGQFHLGRVLSNQHHHVEDVKWLRKAADQGDTEAMYALGFQYYFGWGVARDMNMAIDWFRKAADRGRADAQNMLGGMYEKGDGVLADRSEAMRWYRRAADQGHEDAQTNLARMYEEGRGEQSFAEAVTWYRKAAAQGYAEAEYALGLMYEGGRGVTQDRELAVTWYCKAAEQHYRHAEEALVRLQKQNR